MSQILCFEPFHLGAESLVELPPIESQFFEKRSKGKTDIVYGIMLDDTINSDIARQHEIAARDYARLKLKIEPFYLYESDLKPVVCVLASMLNKDHLNVRKKTAKLHPPWSTAPIKLFGVQNESSVVAKDVLNCSAATLEESFISSISPTCSFYITAWNYVRAFGGKDLTFLASKPRMEVQSFILQMATNLAKALESTEDIMLPVNIVLSFLNRAYEYPEERSRIIAFFLDNERVNKILSSRKYVETEFYNMFDVNDMIEL